MRRPMLSGLSGRSLVYRLSLFGLLRLIIHPFDIDIVSVCLAPDAPLYRASPPLLRPHQSLPRYLDVTYR